MLDLCAGLQGASQVMRANGWQVVTLDYDPSFGCDITTDVRTWHYTGPRPDLIWASPPCDEFAKFAMPCWYLPETLPPPDMSLVIACKRIVDECNPRYWIIENVRGAVSFFDPLLGRPAEVYTPYFLWGHFPPLGNVKRHLFGTKTKHLSSSAKAARAKIPESLSRAVMLAIEEQPELPLYNSGGEKG
jgi:site-specific DNA-cytosine methylase